MDFLLATLTLSTLFYILGVWFSKNYDAGLLMIFSFGLAIATFLVAIFKKRLNIFMILIAFCLLFGSVRFLASEDNRFIREFDNEFITVSGYINSTPCLTDGTHAYRYTLKAETAVYGTNTYKINQNILLNTNEHLSYGDYVTSFGRLTKLSETENEYEYDFSLYYKSKGVHARLIDENTNYTGEKLSFSPMFWIGKLRAYIFNLCDAYFTPDVSAFLKAIILGDKNGFTKDFRELLITSGLSHILHAPFIHITLIYLIVGLLGISKSQSRDQFTILLLIVYALVSGGTGNAIKTATLCAVMIFRRNIFGFSDKLGTLSLIVLIMTIADPYLCFNSGFCMSVVSTILISTSYTPIFQAIYHKFKCNIRCTQLLTMFVIFSIGTMPFSAYLFNGMSLFNVFLAMVFMPMISLVLLTAPVIFAFLAIFGLSPVPSFIMEKLAELFEKVTLFFTKMPFNYLSLNTPGLLDFICFYLLWYLFLLVISRKATKRKACIIVVLFTAFALSGINQYSFNSLSINFVNVGQGDAAILRTAKGDTVLIDGGGSEVYNTSYNIGEEVFLPYLISHGIKHVDVATISHYHQDHMQGIIAALDNVKIDTIVLPCYSSDILPEILKLAQEKGTKVCYFGKDDEIRFRSGLTLSCIAPVDAQLKSFDENHKSLVFAVKYGEFCGLFGGDSNDLLNESYPADVDILKVSHHGSNGSTNEDFLKHTNPEYAVISAGIGNSYGHPNSSVLLRLERQNTEVLRTDKMGDIKFKINKNGHITYEALRPYY